MSELAAEQFPSFFEQVHGVKPYSWQVRMAEEVLETGKFPDTVKLPTGSGKTAIVDIAVFALASQPDVFPRRIVFVIDRRIVVDQVYERVHRIADSIKRSTTPLLQQVRENLEALSDASNPIGCTALRGGTHIDGEWRKRIDQPWVLVSTVDQFGSQLLFRGYNASARMRPIHAGLTGNDCLVVLDEVHLSVPFRDTLREIQSLKLSQSDLLPSRFQVVEMSATVRESTNEPFELTASDLDESPPLRRRVFAKKRIELGEISNRESVPKHITTLITSLQRSLPKERLQKPSPCFTVGVIVNRVETAREI